MTNFKGKLCYLGSPYTHENPKIMKLRWIKVCKISAKMIRRGLHNLCPIASSAPVAKYGNILQTDWAYWRDLDLNYLKRCDYMGVCMLDKEWYKSVGMRAEIEFAIANKIPVIAIDKHGDLLPNLMNEDILKLMDFLQAEKV